MSQEEYDLFKRRSDAEELDAIREQAETEAAHLGLIDNLT